MAITIVRLGVAAFACAAGLWAPPALAFSCSPATDSTRSPYTESKYRTVIDNSQQLQVQTTSTCLTTSDMQAHKIDSNNWYLDNGNMLFTFTGGVTGERDELRGRSFNGASTGKRWSGKLKVQNGGSYSGQFTVGQIFGESTQDPIVRLEFFASRQGVSNHLWAIYRPDTGDKVTLQYFDLGPATTTSYTPVTMEYGTNRRIQVTYGSTTHDFSDNFSYWFSSSKTVYFKAGCYLQAGGDCAVTYSSLTFDS